MRWFLHPLVVAFAVLAPGHALACACCTDPGQRLVGAEAIDAYAQGLLDQLSFGSEALLFTGNASPEDITPITATSDRFTLVVGRDGARWVLTFKDEAGAESTLKFSTPAKVSRFEVDPRDSAEAPPNGPGLYKEWRITAKARGSGMFKSAADPLATLIIHGRGNSCTDASQFTAWTIVLQSGTEAATFFGLLQP
jgi:hypothetical protein